MFDFGDGDCTLRASRRRGLPARFAAMCRERAGQETTVVAEPRALGGPSGARSHDLRIKSPQLYQLSYRPGNRFDTSSQPVRPPPFWWPERCLPCAA